MLRHPSRKLGQWKKIHHLSDPQRRTHSEPQEPPSPQAGREHSEGEPSPGEQAYSRVPQADPNAEGQENDWWHQDQWYRWRSWHGRSWSRRDEDESSEEEEPDTLTWAGLEIADQEVLPSEILGWILLRRAGLSAGARLMVLAAAHNSLRFEDVEKALRDQQEELLMTEGYNRRNSPHHKRTYWLEEDE